MSNRDNIQVYVRLRPNSNVNGRTKSEGETSSFYNLSNDLKTIDIYPQKLRRIGSNDIDECYTENNYGCFDDQRTNSFSFNKIFDESTSQSTIFNETITPILDSVMKGYNSTIMCYGQTGSGKTYTMMGLEKPSNPSSESDEHKGIIPRLFDKIFDEIEHSPPTSQYTIALSYFEIYNDTINDLLNPANDMSEIYIKESPMISSDSPLTTSNIYVEGLDKVYVANIYDVKEIIKLGNSNRKVAQTRLNILSSRSHSILRVELSSRKNNDTSNETLYTSTLFLVDLAGSERIYKSGTNNSDNSLKETIGINSSLSVLGNVINLLALKKNNKSNIHIPYRESKLTRILQNSLGGNSKTAIIINCSTDPSNVSETLSSLRFAQRAKSVYNMTSINKSTLRVKKGKNFTRNGNTVDNSDDRDNDADSDPDPDPDPDPDADNYKDQKSRTSRDKTGSWKSKYVNALKKIVKLETQIEFSKNSSINCGEVDEYIKSLKNENTKLKDENKIYKQTFRDLKNENLQEAIDYKLATTSTVRSLQSLKSDIEIYKKLLVSKTDKILELEEELEYIKNLDASNSNRILNIKNSPNLEPLNLMKSMTKNINLHNIELSQQVRDAERLLIQKEKQLNDMSNKLSERDNTINFEHNEVSKKLSDLSKRLNNHDSVFPSNTSSNIRDAENLTFEGSDLIKYPNGDKDNVSPLSDANSKNGLNLRIVKPR